MKARPAIEATLSELVRKHGFRLGSLHRAFLLWKNQQRQHVPGHFIAEWTTNR
jgi:hypothetical protein